MSTNAERDEFADDVLERISRSNLDYQRTHGHYIVPLAERLLAARAEVEQLRAALTWIYDNTCAYHKGEQGKADAIAAISREAREALRAVRG